MTVSTVNSRFASYVLVHQLNRVRVLGGGIDAWINDLFEFYAYAASLERLASIVTKLNSVTVELKYKEAIDILNQLKIGSSILSLEDTKLLMYRFYELLEEIETIAEIEPPEDTDALEFALGELHGTEG